ncbi:hypothetical protein RND81_14G145300 [Saponaria officinalis]|uniref:Late embryogenesis abundant protein LEA-2 subgroup domain-containing protein n=1 Tax=Saponaria officinalis TaxID=3572 RepID=A0AAW1GLV2_SAPOF
MVGPRTSQSSATKRKSPIPMIAIFCLVLILIIGLAILIAWLAIKPKKLQYSIDEGWIRDYNLSNGQLSSTFNFVIRTYNPNRKTSVYYNKMEVTVLYRGQTVAFDTIEPFFQPRRNVTRLMFQNTAHNVVLPPNIVRDLKVERTGGEVDLDVKIRAKLKFKVGVWKSRHYKLKALCSPVIVNFSNDTKSQPRDCDVDI